MPKAKSAKKLSLTTSHRLQMELNSMVRDIEYCRLENIKFEPDTNSFQFRDGKWSADHSNFPIDGDNVLDIMIIVTGNPGLIPELGMIEIELTLNDGNTVRQWGNQALWSMYRGGNQTPHFLQSILMALETNLFELAETSDTRQHSVLRSIFNFLYAGSRSVATTSVLASVAMAYPKIIGDAVLPILSNKYCYLWDISRYMEESLTNFSFLSPQDIHDLDREESNKRPHRKIFKGLMTHVMYNLLADGALKNSILAFFDRFHSEITEDKNIMWQKTLAEMDIRTWKITSDPEVPGKVFIQPDFQGAVKEFLEEDAEEREKSGMEAGYANWTNGVYKEPDTSAEAFARWKLIHDYYSSDSLSDTMFARPSTLAIIGLRDFPNKLTKPEKNWAINSIYSTLDSLAIDRYSGENDLQLQGKYNIMEVEPCFAFIPNLFALIKTKKGVTELKRKILSWLLAYLHPNEKNHLVGALRYHVATIDAEFVKRCVFLFIKYAEQSSKSNFWRDSYHQVDEHSKKRILQRLISRSLAIKNVSIDSGTIPFNHTANPYLKEAFILIPSNTHDVELVDFCIGYAKWHIDEMAKERYGQGDNNFESRNAIKYHIPYLLLYISPGKAKDIIVYIFNAYDKDPHVPRSRFPYSQRQEYLRSIMEYLIRALDKSVATDDEDLMTKNFWSLWEKLHDKNKLRESYHFSSLLLLQIGWKTEATHWRPLSGKSNFLIELISYYGALNLPACIALLATIGEEVLMPSGITLITNLLRDNEYLRVILGGGR